MSQSYRCPGCGSEGPFLAHVTDYVRVDAQDNVTVEVCGDFEPNEDMDCEACEGTFLVEAFVNAALARDAAYRAAEQVFPPMPSPEVE